MQSVNALLARFLIFLSALAVLGMTLMVFLQVVFRYVLQSPLPWTEESARFLLVALTFLGGAAASYYRLHPALDLITARVAQAHQRSLQVFAQLVTLFMGTVMLTAGALLSQRTLTQTSPVLQLPMGLVNVVIPLAGACLIFFAVEQIVAFARGADRRSLAALVALWALLCAPVALQAWGWGWLAPLAAPLLALGTTGTLLVAFAVLAALGVPMVFVVGFSGLLALLVGGSTPLIFPSRLFAGADSFALLAVPLFVLAGAIMAEGGITQAIVRFAQSLIGWVRGGLGLVSVLAAMLFAGVSGAAVAEASALGRILIPAMRDEGYEEEVAASVVASASTIGPIIPPSIPFILYGSLAGTSIGALFAAGLVPGVLMGLGLMLLTYVLARRRGYRAETFGGPAVIWGAFRRAFFALLTPLIILGGILGGVFTATEAAGFAAIYALLLTLVTRQLSWERLSGALREAAGTTAVVMLLIAFANITGYVLARQQIPELLAGELLALSSNPYVILLLVNLLLLVVGMLLDLTPALIIFLPVLQPTMLQLGVDPVHFGVIMVLNLVIGLLTPPVGAVLFVTAAVGKVPLARLSRTVVPFISILVGVLLLVTYVPAVSLAVPRALGLLP